MTNDYIKFINFFKAQTAANGWDYERVAEIMNVHANTVRNWFAFRSTMSAEDLLKCVKRILGGYIA